MLEKFYNSTGGAGWEIRTNWLQSTTACTWYGVTCSTTTTVPKNVIRLQLVSNNLSGTLPPEISSLAQLQTLSLPDNLLTGTIPTEIGTLAQLQSLDLGRNKLSGILPASLTKLINLKSLSLNENQLSGSLPIDLGNLANLTRIALGANQLTGSIPASIATVTQLTYLSLFRNRLTGPIPPQISNLTQLEVLSLGENQLTGDIAFLPSLINLQLVRLDHNQLSGSLPTGLNALTQLTELTLAANQLSGSVPPQLGSLTSLITVTLGVNQLTGSIPKEIGNLTQLTFLSMFRNRLSGTIPAELGNLTQLRVLSLAENLLVGPLPETFSRLVNLNIVRLNQNQLNGNLPTGLKALTQLTELTLAANHFSGPIPPELGELSNLTQLHLWHNQFSGPIPKALGKLGNLQKLYLADNLLTGSIPVEVGNLTKLTLLDLERNQITGTLPITFNLLANLQTLHIGGNLGLRGDLPRTLTGLANLSEFWFDNTRLCEPKATDFQSWLTKIKNLRRTDLLCATALNLNKSVTPALVTPAQALQGVTAAVQLTITAEAPAMINLTDTMPSGLTYVTGSASGAVYNAATRQLTINANVAPGQPFLLRYQVTMDKNSNPGTLFDIPTVVTGVNAQTVRDSATLVIQNQQAVGTLVLIYVVADNDLGSEAIRLINNAEKTTSNPNDGSLVTMLMLDGPNRNDAYLYILQPDPSDLSCPNYTDHFCNNRYELAKNVFEWREDTTSPDAVQDFIVKAINAYPGAQRVVLSLVGHGSGWSPDLLPAQPKGWSDQPGGLLWDSTTNHALSTMELGQVLGVAQQQTGKKLALLYLDACSMAMSEVAYEVAAYADYLLAAQNQSWAAFPYDQFLNDARTATSGEEIGKRWLATAKQVLQTTDGGYPFTLSLIDLSQLANLASQQQQLTVALRNVLATPGAKTTLETAFQQTRCFDSNYDGVIAPGSDSYCDLRSFARQLQSLFSDEAVVNAAQQILTAIQTTVKGEAHQNGAPWFYPGNFWNFGDQPGELGGISIYLPLNSQHDEARRRYYTSQQLKWVAVTQWNELLSDFWGDQVSPTVTDCVNCHTILKPLPTATLSSTLSLRATQSSVQPSSQLTVSVDLLNINQAHPLGAATIAILYDPTVLRSVACVDRSALRLPTDAIYLCNATTNSGRVEISLASPSGIGNDTILAQVSFLVVGQPGQQSALGLQVSNAYESNGTNLTFGTAGSLVTVIGTNPGYLRGDADCGQGVGIGDALAILRYSVALLGATNRCSPGQTNVINTLACDVNQDQNCTVADALWIAQCTADIRNAFCPGQLTTEQVVAIAATTYPTITFGQIQQDADNTLVVPILAQIPAERLGAATIDVQYDPTQFQLLACQSTVELFMCNEQFAPSNNGSATARFSLLASTGLAGDVPLAQLRFQAIGDQQQPITNLGASLRLAPITLIDDQGNPLVPTGANRIYLTVIQR